MKNVYTKEMYDAGLKPRVGYTVKIVGVESDGRISDFEGLDVIIIGDSTTERGDEVLTFSHYTRGIGCGCWFNGGVFHPIKTPEQLKQEKLDEQVKHVAQAICNEHCRIADNYNKTWEFFKSEAIQLQKSGLLKEIK